jgi:hypothetical protein
MTSFHGLVRLPLFLHAAVVGVQRLEDLRVVVRHCPSMALPAALAAGALTDEEATDVESPARIVAAVPRRLRSLAAVSFAAADVSVVACVLSTACGIGISGAPLNRLAMIAPENSRRD